MNASSVNQCTISAVPLVEARVAEQFGGKAAELSLAMSKGLPVPAGFALSTIEAHRIAEGSADLPEALVQAGPWAVRSSATGEDGLSSSFAGQYLSLLGVSGASLREAVTRVVGSAHENGADAYRERRGEDSLPSMAVVIQRMVQADRAGVLFTQHPVTKRDLRVVEASWGLGELVVGGVVTPDRFEFDRALSAIARYPGEKDVAHYLTAEGAVREEEIHGSQVTDLCLNEGELAQLNQLALRCEAVANRPVDLEWAFQDGELYLLQMRPITT